MTDESNMSISDELAATVAAMGAPVQKAAQPQKMSGEQTEDGGVG